MISYLLLFFWCFTAASIIPISCEPYFVKLVYDSNTWILVTIIASIANSLGSITTFWIGKKAAEITLKKASEKNTKRYNKAKQIISKYGPASLILAWVPFLGDIVVVVAGALQCNFKHSVIWIVIGKTLRFVLLALITLAII